MEQLGKTALHWAATSTCPDTVFALLRAGADVDAQDSVRGALLCFVSVRVCVASTCECLKILVYVYVYGCA